MASNKKLLRHQGVSQDRPGPNLRCTRHGSPLLMPQSSSFHDPVDMPMYISLLYIYICIFYIFVIYHIFLVYISKDIR